jgi:multisubunit Na+/H+ antiporter MnhB subunit
MARRPIQVGEGGRSLGALRPTGHVEIGGVRHEARSRGEFIPPDTLVIVETVESFHLIVRVQKPDDVPLRIHDDHDAQALKELSARRDAHSERQRKLREMLITHLLGTFLGVLLFFALHSAPDLRLLSFAAWGMVAGALYIAFLRLFLVSAHELVSENISLRPGVWLLIVLPAVGAFLGAVGGFQLDGSEGAIRGTLAVAFVLPPVLCLAWRLLVTLLETL